MDPEPTPDGSNGWEVDLELLVGPDFLYGPTTEGADLRQGNIVVLVDFSGWGKKRSSTVRLAGLAARRRGVGLRLALGEGRCLALAAPGEFLHALLQPGDLILEMSNPTAKRRVFGEQLVVGRLAWRRFVCHSLFIGRTPPTLYSNPVNRYSPINRTATLHLLQVA
jgi:hypothetical protein